MTPESRDVIIIGAGPAGLALAYELSRRGIDYLILEKGDGPGHSFSRFPKTIWFGPWLNNTLPGSRVPWTWLLRRTSQPAYTWYLRQYASLHQLRIRNRTAVHTVSRTGGGFLVDGRFSCRYLVNATGYFSKPYTPDFPGLHNTEIPFLHSSDYREPDDARRRAAGAKQTVLVVGQGLSAGETMCELHRAGFRVALSHRGPLVIGPSPLAEALMSPFSFVAERLALLLRLRLNSNPPMAGGESRRLLESGWVEILPEIERFEQHKVVFADKRERFFDLVVFCTGYRYAMDHLARLLGTEAPELSEELESVQAPGLFFLGMDQQRTYRSRFLRGIRADASYLAGILDRRLESPQPRKLEPEREFVVDPGASAPVLSRQS